MPIRDIVAAFAAPAVAVLAVGVGAALAAGSGFEGRAAYGGSLERFSEAEARAHAAQVFQRADLNRSGDLDADEYASLAVVVAELARFNGFLALEIGGEADTIPLPAAARGGLTTAERIRIDAVARAEFYAAAGEDMRLSRDEFVGESAARFSAADRNGDGALVRGELSAFAALAARVPGSDV
ncbi:MAG: hypothetical protein Kow00133_08360 [Amphiplicatus sp.]